VDIGTGLRLANSTGWTIGRHAGIFQTGAHITTVSAGLKTELTKHPANRFVFTDGRLTRFEFVAPNRIGPVALANRTTVRAGLEPVGAVHGAHRTPTAVRSARASRTTARVVLVAVVARRETQRTFTTDQRLLAVRVFCVVRVLLVCVVVIFTRLVFCWYARLMTIMSTDQWYIVVIVSHVFTHMFTHHMSSTHHMPTTHVTVSIMATNCLNNKSSCQPDDYYSLHFTTSFSQQSRKFLK
jgi:hypothetical protein